MVEYVETIENRIKIIKQFCFYSIKNRILITAIALVFSLFFIIVGLVDDVEALNYGYPLLALVIISCITIVLYYFNLKKSLISIYYGLSKNGRIEMAIELIDNEFIFTNKTKGNVNKYNASSIVKTVIYKDLIILYFNTKQFILIPKMESTLKLFNVEPKEIKWDK